MKLKDILLGAAAQLIPKTVSHFAFNYMAIVQGIPIEELHKNPWFMEVLGPSFPAVDDIILDIGLPATLLLASLKKSKYQEALRGMGVGSAISGGATLIHDLLMRSGVWLTPAP